MRAFLILIAGLAVLVAGIGFDAWRVLNAPLRLDAPATIVIAKGQPFEAVLRNMAASGWLPATPRSVVYLRAYGRARGLSRQVKSGEFRLEPGQSLRDALQVIVAGRPVLYELRLIEGWTAAQALRAIHDDSRIRKTAEAGALPDVMRALGRDGMPAEGRFFPDTYRFARGTSDLELLRQASARMDRVLDEEWAGRDAELPYADAGQALTMASIVEKETGDEAERAQIAGVFVRRLKLGMRLQTDPTVIYGLGDSFDGNLRLRDLRADTPYNTYTRHGLPPTPICLPGRAAIHAALHPAAGKALFFVSRGDGTHAFSATLREHERAVRRFQLQKR